jgi:hypothetical protein
VQCVGNVTDLNHNGHAQNMKTCGGHVKPKTCARLPSRGAGWPQPPPRAAIRSPVPPPPHTLHTAATHP